MMKKQTKLLFIPLLALSLFSCSKEIENSDNKVIQEVAVQEILPCRVGTQLHTIEIDGVTSVQQPAPMLPETKTGELPDKIIIPMVFHVYGTSHGSGKIDLERIQNVVKWINNDFHGLQNYKDIDWYDTVISDFDDVKSNFLDIEFVLAQFDPEGEPTTGVLFHPASKAKAGGPGKGYGDSPAGDKYVLEYAWDNFMYMNIFVTSALYGEIDTNSGVSWYPNIKMSEKGIARVAYNGRYLPGGTNPFGVDATSILTHEFGHFFNLRHTFDAYECIKGDPGTNSGDWCADTPQQEKSYWSSTKPNCDGVLINHENYMNYGSYSNFTKDQVKRMRAALMHESRKTLWSADNLRNTMGIGGVPDKPTPTPDTPTTPTPDEPTTPTPEEDPNVTKSGDNFIVQGDSGSIPAIYDNCLLEVFDLNGSLVYRNAKYTGTFDIASELKSGTYRYIQKKGDKVSKGAIEII